MRQFLRFLGVALALPSLALAQTAARTYTTTSDKAGNVSVFGFYNPSDQKTYVLDGDPASFAVPVTGSFSVSPAPVQYLRNGTATDATVDTVTPTNNRPLPFSLFSGDGGNPAVFGVGTSNAATLRVHVGNASDIPVSVNNNVVSVLTNGSSTPYTSTAQSGGKTSLDVAAYQAGTWNVGVTSSALPTGAATEATLSTLNGKVTAVDTGNVTVASSALPTGAATAANQATGNTSLSSIDGKLPALASGRVPVDGSGVTQPVSGTVSVSGTSSVNVSQVGGISTSTDFGVPGSGTQRVAALLGVGSTAASVTNPVPTRSQGRGVVTTFRQNLASDSLNTTYDQVVASTSAATARISVFSPIDEPLWLATGAAASESVLLYIPPGGGEFDVSIASGTRVAIRSEASTYTSGYVVISLLGQ